ncbi:pyridoxamine 5'-phosphate oxidase family protein [Streptomyces sp. TR06-5]|uniref:pyridoxamine 5'-phosphate oxidase family protein n=1 Tax=unclassified Streptomyces TaxID=2593676 RepID=UPI00399FA1DC
MPTGPVPAPRYPVTERTTATRARERVAYDRDRVHGILDAGYLCHLGFVRDHAPVVLPTLYARVGERLYVHGSTGSRPLRSAGDGSAGHPTLPVCLTVTHVDGLVLARAAFHHSVNYRSVVVHGNARQVTDPVEHSAALDALVENLLPGRAADCRPADTRETAATAVLAVDLEEVSAKVRTGDPVDDDRDTELPYWAGVVPVHSSYGEPAPAADLADGVPVPDYLRRL